MRTASAIFSFSGNKGFSAAIASSGQFSINSMSAARYHSHPIVRIELNDPPRGFKTLPHVFKAVIDLKLHLAQRRLLLFQSLQRRRVVREGAVLPLSAPAPLDSEAPNTNSAPRQDQEKRCRCPHLLFHAYASAFDPLPYLLFGRRAGRSDRFNCNGGGAVCIIDRFARPSCFCIAYQKRRRKHIACACRVALLRWIRRERLRPALLIQDGSRVSPASRRSAATGNGTDPVRPERGRCPPRSKSARPAAAKSAPHAPCVSRGYFPPRPTRGATPAAPRPSTFREPPPTRMAPPRPRAGIGKVCPAFQYRLGQPLLSRARRRLWSRCVRRPPLSYRFSKVVVRCEWTRPDLYIFRKVRVKIGGEGAISSVFAPRLRAVTPAYAADPPAYIRWRRCRGINDRR